MRMHLGRTPSAVAVFLTFAGLALTGATVFACVDGASLQVSPASGPPGTSGSLTGTGLPAATVVTAWWISGQTVGSATTDQTGTLHAMAFTVPSGPPGATAIVLKAATMPQHSVRVAFQVTGSPTAPPTPSATPPPATPTATPPAATSTPAPTPTPTPTPTPAPPRGTSGSSATPPAATGSVATAAPLDSAAQPDSTPSDTFAPQTGSLRVAIATTSAGDAPTTAGRPASAALPPSRESSRVMIVLAVLGAIIGVAAGGGLLVVRWRRGRR